MSYERLGMAQCDCGTVRLADETAPCSKCGRSEQGDANMRALASRFVRALQRGHCPWCKGAPPCLPGCPARAFLLECDFTNTEVPG